MPQSEQPKYGYFSNKVEVSEWKELKKKFEKDFWVEDPLSEKLFEWVRVNVISPLQSKIESEQKIFGDQFKKLFEWYQSKIEELKGEVEEKEKVVKSKHAVIEMYRKELCKISSLESENVKLISGLESVREQIRQENYPEADFVAREALSK